MKISWGRVSIFTLIFFVVSLLTRGAAASSTTVVGPSQKKSRFQITSIFKPHLNHKMDNSILARKLPRKDFSNPVPSSDASNSNAVSMAKRTLLLCALVYGSCYVSTKHLQGIIPGELINFIRFSLAALWFLPDIVSFRGSSNVVLVGFELGFWCAIGFLAQAMALKFSSASKAALFSSLGVLIPPVLDYFEALITKQKPAHQTVGTTQNMNAFQKVIKSPFFSPILAMLGAGIIEWGGIEQPHWSDLILLVTPLCFATCFWRSEKHAARFPQDTNTITGLMLTTSAIFFCFWSLWTSTFPYSKVEWLNTWQVLSKDWRNLAVLVFNGLVATGWTALSEQKSLKVLTAADTSVIYALEPIFASIFSFLLLNEHIGINTVLGAVLIILACISH